MSRPTERADIAIVGGGIFGAALAYHLARLGSSEVLLFDQGAPGSGSTGRGAGILTFQGWEGWDLGLVRASAEELRLLSESTGAGDFRASGGLRVARTEDGARWLEAVRATLDRAGVPATTFGPNEIDSVVPWADLGDVKEALLTPGDATFDGAEIARAYLRLAVRGGARVLTDRGWAEVRRDTDDWAVRSLGTEVRSERLVLAAGPFTKQLARGAGYELPVAPFRAQACRVRPAPLVDEFPTLHDLDLDLYVRPAAPGEVLLGDGTERRESEPVRDGTGGDPAFPPGAIARLREIAPGWETATVEEAWGGLCVASPDAYPLVGAVPGASRLFVATGFNGFGAMRAPALAFHLARGIRDDVWGPLVPAAPGRFPSGTPSPVPDPRFPLELGASLERATLSAGDGEVAPASPPPADPISSRLLHDRAEIAALVLPHLSDWFDPFLPRFLADALRVGGTAEVAAVDNEVRGVYLSSPTEGVGSVFTRTRAVAEHYLARAGPGGLYADRPWAPGGEPITIMAADLRDYVFRGTIRTPVRLAEREDLPRVGEFMREVAGEVDDAWLGTLPRQDELCFLCEVDGRIAGVSWASVVGHHARGHSFMVRPRFRGLGVGTDLLHARMMWLRGEGVVRVVSEIYEGNAGSEVAAERAGMARVGRMYHYRRTDPGGAPGVV